MTDDGDLERVIDKALKRLPQPRAPHTLRPRVLAAVAIARRPGYLKPWFAWPRASQLATLFVVAAVAGGFGVLSVFPSYTLVEWNPAWWVATSDLASRIAGALDLALAPGRTVWRALVAPVAGYLTAIVLLMSFALISFGLALRRVASGEFAQ